MNSHQIKLLNFAKESIATVLESAAEAPFSQDLIRRLSELDGIKYKLESFMMKEQLNLRGSTNHTKVCLGCDRELPENEFFANHKHFCKDCLFEGRNI